MDTVHAFIIYGTYVALTAISLYLIAATRSERAESNRQHASATATRIRQQQRQQQQQRLRRLRQRTKCEGVIIRHRIGKEVW